MVDIPYMLECGRTSKAWWCGYSGCSVVYCIRYSTCLRRRFRGVWAGGNVYTRARTGQAGGETVASHARDKVYVLRIPKRHPTNQASAQRCDARVPDRPTSQSDTFSCRSASLSPPERLACLGVYKKYLTYVPLRSGRCCFSAAHVAYCKSGEPTLPTWRGGRESTP